MTEPFIYPFSAVDLSENSQDFFSALAWFFEQLKRKKAEQQNFAPLAIDFVIPKCLFEGREISLELKLNPIGGSYKPVVKATGLKGAPLAEEEEKNISGRVLNFYANRNSQSANSSAMSVEVTADDEELSEYEREIQHSMSELPAAAKRDERNDRLKKASRPFLQAAAVLVALPIFLMGIAHIVGLHVFGLHLLRATHVVDTVADIAAFLGAAGVAKYICDKHKAYRATQTINTKTEAFVTPDLPVVLKDSDGGTVGGSRKMYQDPVQNQTAEPVLDQANSLRSG